MIRLLARLGREFARQYQEDDTRVFNEDVASVFKRISGRYFELVMSDGEIKIGISAASAS